MIDRLRFLGPVCYSICRILAYLIWMETNLAIPVLFVKLYYYKIDLKGINMGPGKWVSKNSVPVTDNSVSMSSQII